MAKSLKEYLGLSTIRVGGLDSIHPIASLGDLPPKDQGSRDSRAVGLQASKMSPFKKRILSKLSKPIKDYLKSKEKKEDGMTGPGLGTYNAIADISTKKIKKEDTNRVLRPDVIYLNDKTAIVGQHHGYPLSLSNENLEKIQFLAKKYGAYSEGNRADEKYTKGQIDNYKGSWDDLFSDSIKNYPYQFIYSIMANVDFNETWNQVGYNDNETIFNQILKTQKNHNFFPNKKYDGETLLKFLKSISEEKYNFVKMAEKPATKNNVYNFLKTGESLMWPENWELYPNNAGKIAKQANDLRDKFLVSRTEGVYTVGIGHLIEIEKLAIKNKLSEDTNRIARKPGQPAGSDKHSDLYTDENPKGTIHGLGFTDAETARTSVNKIKNSGKTHAHKIQAAIAMSQRAKVASERAKDPKKKKDLAAAHKIYQSFIDTNKKKD